MTVTEVEVCANKLLGPEIFLMTLRGKEICRGARPGQFVMLRPSGAPEPLLGRPMSLCQVGPAREPATETDSFQILYQVVGSGTRLMARLAPGDVISCLGPLGRGFRSPGPPSAPAILVAGGIGIAPFPFFADRLQASGIPWRLLYGARSSANLVGLEWFQPCDTEPIVVTEDGSAGRKGLVTEPLGSVLESAGSEARVYVCGPEPMLRAVARICRDRGVRCQLSLEGVMPCGFGVCLGCSVPAASEGEYLRMCTEGPVFLREEIGW